MCHTEYLLLGFTCGHTQLIVPEGELFCPLWNEYKAQAGEWRHSHPQPPCDDYSRTLDMPQNRPCDECVDAMRAQVRAQAQVLAQAQAQALAQARARAHAQAHANYTVRSQSGHNPNPAPFNPANTHETRTEHQIDYEQQQQQQSLRPHTSHGAFPAAGSSRHSALAPSVDHTSRLYQVPGIQLDLYPASPFRDSLSTQAVPVSSPSSDNTAQTQPTGQLQDWEEVFVNTHDLSNCALSWPHLPFLSKAPVITLPQGTHIYEGLDDESNWRLVLHALRTAIEALEASPFGSLPMKPVQAPPNSFETPSVIPYNGTPKPQPLLHSMKQDMVNTWLDGLTGRPRTSERTPARESSSSRASVGSTRHSSALQHLSGTETGSSSSATPSIPRRPDCTDFWTRPLIKPTRPATSSTVPPITPVIPSSAPKTQVSSSSKQGGGRHRLGPRVDVAEVGHIAMRIIQSYERPGPPPNPMLKRSTNMSDLQLPRKDMRKKLKRTGTT